MHITTYVPSMVKWINFQNGDPSHFGRDIYIHLILIMEFGIEKRYLNESLDPVVDIAKS